MWTRSNFDWWLFKIQNVQTVLKNIWRFLYKGKKKFLLYGSAYLLLDIFPKKFTKYIHIIHTCGFLKQIYSQFSNLSVSRISSIRVRRWIRTVNFCLRWKRNEQSFHDSKINERGKINTKELVENEKNKRKTARPEHRNTLTVGSYSHLWSE